MISFTSEAEVLSVAAALYDGGWRHEDEQWLIEDYGWSVDGAREICKYLKKWEEQLRANS